MSEPTPPEPHKPSLFQVIGSALAAAFGVQSDKNRQRDFASGSLRSFILVGIIGTILFILAIYLIVRLVLSFAGV